MLKIAHIINPVKVKDTSDLFFAQPITFETMRRAKEFAKDKVQVSLFSAQFAEDADYAPGFFTCTPHLERSALDLGRFQKKRKLPLLKDILDRLYRAGDADYFIYTNADIGLQPYFYSALAGFTAAGYDAFVINRRTLSDRFKKVAEIPLIYAEAGEVHIGHDCFVFKREAYPRFKLGNVCIGVRLVGRVLLWNLMAYAKKFEEFKDLHMTFHIGRNKPWKNPGFADYDKLNEAEAIKVLGELNREQDFINMLKKNHPGYLTAVNLQAFD
ncbi:MAG: hypothetical protein KAW12_18160 [Candidatus Aminicenantes bacterium]|nr:hypothetical protein [Candidatus Aminicenantes bacterium]